MQLQLNFVEMLKCSLTKLCFDILLKCSCSYSVYLLVREEEGEQRGDDEAEERLAVGEGAAEEHDGLVGGGKTYRKHQAPRMPRRTRSEKGCARSEAARETATTAA